MDKIMTNNSNLRENVRIQFTYNGYDYKSPKYLKINMLLLHVPLSYPI